MRKVTPRNPVNENLYNLIGRNLTTNLFPTFRGKLVFIQDEKCYFEILANETFEKYNMCEGKIEYLPSPMVITMKFDEE